MGGVYEIDTFYAQGKSYPRHKKFKLIQFLS